MKLNNKNEAKDLTEKQMILRQQNNIISSLTKELKRLERKYRALSMVYNIEKEKCLKYMSIDEFEAKLIETKKN